MKTPKSPPKKFNLRMPVDLMEEAQQQADALGVSLNAYCLMAIRNFIGWTERQTRAASRKAAAGSPKAATGTSRAPAPAYKAGRNDPCPCGSGRKFKHCHGSPDAS